MFAKLFKLFGWRRDKVANNERLDYFLKYSAMNEEESTDDEDDETTLKNSPAKPNTPEPKPADASLMDSTVESNTPAAMVPIKLGPIGPKRSPIYFPKQNYRQRKAYIPYAPFVVRIKLPPNPARRVIPQPPYRYDPLLAGESSESLNHDNSPTHWTNY